MNAHQKNLTTRPHDNREINGANPGSKALWAAEDAEALLAVGSEDPRSGGA